MEDPNNRKCPCTTVGVYTKYRVLTGAILMIIPSGLTWYFGNLLPYAYSYFRCNLGDPDAYGKIVWILPLFLVFAVVGGLSVDALSKPFSLGVGVPLLLGVLVYNGCTFLTYWSVQHSAWAMALTFGVGLGFGHGIMWTLGFVFSQQWFERRVAMATSAVTSTISLGAILMVVLTTAFLNPDNLQPNRQDGPIPYFSSRAINDSFPSLFLVFGAISTFFHVFGSLLLTVTFINIGPTEGCLDSSELGLESKKFTDARITESSHLVISDGAPRVYTKQTITDKDFLRENPCDVGEFRKDEICGITSSVNNIHMDVNRHPSCDDKGINNSGSALKLVFKSENFYHVWFGMFAMSIGLIVASSECKLFGETLIHDDDFFVAVGTTTNVMVAVIRVAAGYAVDRIGVFKTIVMTLALNSLLMASWYFAAILSRWTFLMWTACLSGLQGSTFISFPIAILKLFGSTYYASYSNLLRSSLLVASFATPPLMSVIVTEVGWVWLFLLCTSVTLISMVLFLLRVSPKAFQ